MGNDTSKRNSEIYSKIPVAATDHSSKEQDLKQIESNSTISEKIKENIAEQKKIEIDKEINENTNVKEWKVNDPIYMYSAVMNEYMPGIIAEIDEYTTEYTLRYWDIQSLEIKHKKRQLLLDSNEVKIRELKDNNKSDPWNMPYSDTNLSEEIVKEIRECLSVKYGNIINMKENIDINEWFIKFKIYLTEKKTLRIQNPFIRLISAYLSENSQGWIHIFIRYIYAMTVFQQTSNDSKHLNAKLEILFNILNVGSKHIDREALHIICALYAKGMITQSNDENESVTQQNERKTKIAEFGKKLVGKITQFDDEIDIYEFKQMIEESTEMSDIVRQSVNTIDFTERAKFDCS